MSCPKCGGDLIGDGYTVVIHCEYADESKYEYHEPDSDPIYCDFEESNQGYSCTRMCLQIGEINVQNFVQIYHHMANYAYGINFNLFGLAC